MTGNTVQSKVYVWHAPDGLNMVPVTAVNPFPVTGSISATNPSVGTNTSVAPTSSTEIGFIDGSGNLQGVSGTNPLPVSGSFTPVDMLNATGSSGSAAVLFTTANVADYFSCAVQVTAYSAGSTLIAEGSNDGTTWAVITDVFGNVSMTGLGEFLFPAATKQFRIRVSVFAGGGTNTVNANFRSSVYGVSGQPVAQSGTWNVGLNAGSAVIGHVIADSGSTTAVTGNVTVVQGTGTNLHTVVDAGSAIIGKVGIDQTTPGTTNAVATTNFPTTVDTNSGNKSASTLRMVLATDQPALINALKVDGSAVTQPVDGATAVAASIANPPVTIGGRGSTALPTAVTDGQVQNAILDKVGRQVVVGSIRDLKGDNTITLTSSTAETTLVAAVASTFNDVYGLIVENTSATPCEVSFRDTTGGSVRFNIEVPANDTRGFMLPESAGWKQTTVNTNWTAQCGTSVASIKVAAIYVGNK